MNKSMKSTFVLDASFSQRRKTPQGFLSVPCKIARTGTQQYRRGEIGLDGNPFEMVTLYRPPEEVFHPDAIASFDGAPITIEHPDELVNAANWRQYSVGMVSNPRQEGDYLMADLLITSQDAIDDIESEKRRQLSCGYEFYFDPHYQAPEGVACDAAQTKIKGNHVAITRKGRAGSAVRVSDTQPEGSVNMRKIAIDGIPFELEEQAAAAVEKLVAQASDSANKLSAAHAQLSELQGKCDALELRASDAEIQKRVEALAGEKVDRDRLASLAKDNDALVKAVIGDADVSGADITAVRTALRVIDTHVQQQPMGDVLGDAIVSAKDHQGETARDHYINSFNQGA